MYFLIDLDDEELFRFDTAAERDKKAAELYFAGVDNIAWFNADDISVYTDEELDGLCIETYEPSVK